MEIGHLSWAPSFEGAELAKEDEALGFDIRYFGDNTCMHTDVYSEMRDAARATTRIKLGTGITNTLTRHPSAVATALAGVQVISGGRVICGVGKGDSAVAVIGEQPQRHAPFLERTAMLRAYLQGETLTINGHESRLEWLERFDYTPVPLEIVCTGPKMLRAAGHLADRVTLNVGTAAERLDWALEQLHAGLAEAGRTREDVTLGMFVMVGVDDDKGVALDKLRPRVAPLAHMASVKGVDLSLQPEKLRKVTERLRHEYDYRGHVRGTTFNHDDYGNSGPIDREFADWYGLAGDGAYIRGRLDELEREYNTEYVFFSALERAEKERLVGTVLPGQPAVA
jgi:5,10-methylenetetrahydromethanopterin reductase